MKTADLVLALLALPEIAKVGRTARSPYFASENEFQIWLDEQFGNGGKGLVGEIEGNSWYFVLPASLDDSDLVAWVHQHACASVGDFRLWKIEDNV